MMPEALRTRMSLPDVWTKWKGKVIRSLRHKGIAGTLIAAVAIAKQILSDRWTLYLNEQFDRRYEVDTVGVERILSDRWTHYLNGRFDRRFAVDTSGILNPPDLQSYPQFKHSNAYAPTPRSMFARMLRWIEVDFRKFVFIDFGCGKGKVVLLAAAVPFKQIIGIELSAELIRVAEDNLRSYRGTRRCNNVRLICTDAREFRAPEEPAIYYLYDPFDAEVLRKVLENLRHSLDAAPRQIYVLYLTPVHRDLLNESGFLTSVRQTPLYSIYKTSVCPDAD
jgi:predicted RNA methylase